MPPEMAAEIDEQRAKYDMSFAEYVRTILREHDGTPFNCHNVVVGVDENGEPRGQKEGAA